MAPRNLALISCELEFNDASTSRSKSTVYTPNDSDTPQHLKETNEVSGVQSDARDSHRPSISYYSDLPVRGAKLPVFMPSGHGRNADFYGRDAILAQMDETFDQVRDQSDDLAGNRLRSFIICGMGGIGKTEVATEYVYSRREKFDAVLWVNADTLQKLNSGFAEIARALALESGTDPYDEIATREVVKGWLSAPTSIINHGTHKADQEASWLLVFDNVDDPDTLEEFWPITGTGCMIVTSRNPLSKDSIYAPTAAIDLPSFEPDEAGPFLQSVSQREFEDKSLEYCTSISKLLGCLPLAITQMGGIIRRRHLSLRDFLAYYEEDAKKLQEMKLPNQDTGYKHNLASVWMLESLSKPANALLMVLSYLDPDQIPEQLLLAEGQSVQLPDYPKTKNLLLRRADRINTKFDHLS